MMLLGVGGTWLGEALEMLSPSTVGSTHLLAWMLYFLIFVIFVDVITGWGKGLYSGMLDSAKNHQGYIRKGGLVVMAISAVAIDLLFSIVLVYLGMGSMTFMGLNVVEAPVVSGFIILWMTLGEILSIIENVGAMGIVLPKFVQEGLNRLHDDINNGDIDIKSKVKLDSDGNTVIENKMKVPSEVESKAKKPKGKEEDSDGSSKE